MELLYIFWIMTLPLLLPQFVHTKGTGSKLKPKPGGRGNEGYGNRRNSLGGGGGLDGDMNDMNSNIDLQNCGSGENATELEQCIDRIYPYVFRNASHEERLLTYLFTNYDINARATMDTSKTVVVQIKFILLRIHGLDERSQVLTTTGLIMSDWVDDRLTWDPQKFGNLTDIIVKADKLWLPELAIMNGAEELMPDFDRIRVLLRHNGSLHWEPGGIFRTTCDIDISYFPFDSQHCPLVIGAYSYHSERMNITNGSDKIETHDLQQNGEWLVYNTGAVWNVAELECCPGMLYSHVVFSLYMKRRYKFYMMNIVLPCLMLSLLIMIGFFLPPDAGEKISLGISVLLAFTVFLLMIADTIPRTSLAIPLMVIYLMATMMLGTISICMTVVVLNVHHRAPRTPVPRWLKRSMLYYLARIVCVRTHYHSVLRRERIYTAKVDQQNYHNQYKDKDYNRNGGLLDEMETMGLTAVLNNRYYNNGPSKPHVLVSSSSVPAPCTNHVQESASLCSNMSHNSTTSGFGLKARQLKLSRSKRSRLFFGDRGRGGEDSDNKVGSNESEEDFSRDWHEIAQVLDRVFFWILLVLMTLSAVFILLYPTYSGIEKLELSKPEEVFDGE